MKLSTALPLAVVSLLASSGVVAEECKEKTTTTCENRVEVLVTDLVYGLKDDVPVEVFEAFVTASSQCLSCVDETDVTALTETADESNLSEQQCKWLGCWCCTHSWCQREDGTNYCPDQCYDDFPECGPDDSRLSAENDGNPYFMNYELNVCMEDITPQDSSTVEYVDHTQMLADLESELATCYEDKDEFLNSWSSLCADSGIDLSLMAKIEGDRSTIMFGASGFDTEHAVVTTYSSDESHRSSSHVIFYSALGFVTVSAFAVVGTAVVVKVLNSRRESEEAQVTQWVSEMAATPETENPLSSVSAPASVSSSS